MAYDHIYTTLGFVDYHLCLFQSNGSVNVHIDMDQPVQSEPRLRLVLAENLLRDINDVIQRMEVRVQPSAYSRNKSPETSLVTYFHLPRVFFSGPAERLILPNRGNFCCCCCCCCCSPTSLIFIYHLHSLSLCPAHGHLPTSNNSPTSTHLISTIWGTNTPTWTQVRNPLAMSQIVSDADTCRFIIAYHKVIFSCSKPFCVRCMCKRHEVIEQIINEDNFVNIKQIIWTLESLDVFDCNPLFPPCFPRSHPSPAELAEMLSELRRVEERLQPFIQRAHTILETATTAEYNNNTVGFKQPN